MNSSSTRRGKEIKVSHLQLVTAKPHDGNSRTLSGPGGASGQKMENTKETFSTIHIYSKQYVESLKSR